MAEHRDLTDPSIHEPKGQSSASDGTVYVADGAGSGAHQLLGTASLDPTELPNPNRVYLTAVIADVSTASFVLLAIPEDMTLVQVDTVLAGAITTVNSIITIVNSTGPATCGTITVAFTGSGEGVMDQLASPANTTLVGGSYLKISTDGGSTNTVPLYITVTLDKA